MNPGITGRKPGQAEANFIDDPIISEPECAKYIGVSIVTLRRMRWAGKIAYVQITDKRLGYRRSTANKLLADRTVQPTA
jgi:predicted site-specific integrase-resolvase